MMESQFGSVWFEPIPEYFRGELDVLHTVDEELVLQSRSLLFDERSRARIQLLVERLRVRLKAYLGEPQLAEAIEEVASSPEGLTTAESMLSPAEEGDEDSLNSLLVWVRSMARRHRDRVSKRDSGATSSRRVALQGEEQEDLDSQLSAFAYDSGILGSEHRTELKEAMLQVLAAARELKSREYSVFILRALDHFSFEAIGNMLGATELSVHHHYYRALTKLREWLQRDADDCAGAQPCSP